MAVSLLRRVCLYNTTRTFTACSSRLYSSDKKGVGSTSPVDSEKEINKQGDDNISEASSRQSGVTPTAVEKFFKVVEKVKQQHEGRTDSSSNISHSAAVETREGVEQEDLSRGTENEPFATMLRKSKFVSLGEFSGRLVEGTIFEVMGDDLYIDFGGKFHCVCPRPKRNPGHYHRGKKVLVTLQAIEMSSAFLGSDKHVTLLEADGTLIGLAPSQGNQRASSFRQ